MPRDGESLPIVFDTVQSQIGGNNLWKYLYDLYDIDTIPDWYNCVGAVTWHQIYTTNIDNLFQRMGSFRSGQRLETVVRGDQPRERDQLFETVQCVHLHGHIDHRANGVSFSLSDFAHHTARPDPWYQSLVDDLCNRPILFIGTKLEEPQLFHYIELRGIRDKSHAENRPKSFLITPTIDPIREKALLQQQFPDCQ